MIVTIGPIYPGETLTLKLYKRDSYDFAYSTYYEFYRRISLTACKTIDDTDIYLQLGQCTTVTFTLLPNHTNWCELYIQNHENSGTYNVEFFYIKFFPICPMGFVRYNGKCECDDVLALVGVLTCNVNNQMILRPANCWITATANNHSQSYAVSRKCPFDYCLPHSSYLALSSPNSQCQFNRSGLLCGQCQEGLSAVLGSSQCHHCSNTYLLLILVFAALGVSLVVIMFAINFTVTDGTINGFILYANIASINFNSTLFFPLYQVPQTFLSIANLDLGIQTCFYNGMDNYAKMWLQLMFPSYLILIAVSLIITSRHSTIVQRLTARRALPVLATLFLLSYTKVLTTISNVLFSYSLVIYLPKHSKTLLWSVDGNVPVFGVKFTILFIVCLLLLLVMLPFNIVLVFTRKLSRYTLVTKFKPLLDAFQGPYKDHCYYWTGLQLMIRAVFFGLSSLDRNIALQIGIVLISLIAGIHGFLCPLKSKIKNIQEFVWLMNLQGMYVFSLFGHDSTSVIITILAGFGMLHFCFITIYYFATYTRIGKVLHDYAISVYLKICNFDGHASNASNNKRMNEIPEVTYNYREYREPLVGM